MSFRENRNVPRRKAYAVAETLGQGRSATISSTRTPRKKLIRLTTVAGSLNGMLKGQLRFLNTEFEVVGVASGTDALHDVSEREGIRTVHVPMRREIALRQDICSLFSLIKLFLRERPFVVHANTPKGSLLAMTAAWLTRVPNRIYMVTGLRFETAQGKFRLLLKTMERLTCFFATKVIPEGDGVKNTLLREGITRKPMQKILNGNINGIDLSYFVRTPEICNQAEKIRSEIGAGKDDFVFGFAGRIVRDKGVNELVRAFVKLRTELGETHRLCLLLLGDFEDALDPVAADVRAEIFNPNSGIFAPGFQKDLRPYYVAMDTFILPSYREGFPNVVLQAGAMALPCIVSDINGCNEIILEGKNGTIIPKADEAALYAAMKRFYEERTTTLPAMAACSRELIASRYEQKAVWGATREMYRNLLSQ